MPRLKTILENRLRDAQKIAVLGIGSELRADDAVGMVIAKGLKSYIKDKKKGQRNSLKVFLGHTAPENLTGEVNKFKPTHLIIIDAVDFHQQAGATGVIDTRAEAGISFSTHRIPLKIIKDYFYKSVACDTIIIGIQPESVEFCGALSPKIQESVRMVSKELREVLKKFM
jgi:hydrogenase 3 maturation protease